MRQCCREDSDERGARPRVSTVPNAIYSDRSTTPLLVVWAAITFFSPALASGQGIAREGLSSFPADTQHWTYSNLAQLRGLPDYPQIRQRLLTRQLQGFEDFLRSMGTDPDKDVDEVVLGWRGQPIDTSAFFGLAEGRFRPEKAHQFFAQHQLPSRQYAGFELFAFGSGEGRADLFFAFLSSSSAAFGRLNDLKVMLDIHAGLRPALDSDAEFVSWEAELEGSSAQWGIAKGKAAVNQAVPWLAAGGKVPGDLNVILGFVQAVLYRIEWSNGFSTHLSVLCQSPENAAALAQVLTLLQTSGQVTAPGSASFLQGLEVQASGSRLEVSASGSLQMLDQVMGQQAASPAR